ncbi:hypothetical protein C4D60_Mb00t17140 [Musa balbisiana]|uniref:Uncharacterized protein n=1 Tax=Musa balbisiana TaxID=52838 RepID=A0A4S8I376_MUSBA|nr:hypothetical protein C4D60_Mb00t17140 [Musa balbisiana]
MPWEGYNSEDAVLISERLKWSCDAGILVETGDILVGKLTPQTANESSYAPEDRLLRAILGIQVSTAKETSLKLPIGGRGRVIDVRWIRKKGFLL